MISRNHFIFNKNKCVGCEACVVACINENGEQITERWRSIKSSNTLKVPSLPLYYLSLACGHCEEAPCMKYCPALAFKRSNKTGAVLHIEDNCIGCKYCIWQCPYGAPKYNSGKGIVDKCTFCESRLIDGQKPACTSLCPTGALDYSYSEIDFKVAAPDLKVENFPQPLVKIIELEREAAPKTDPELFKEFKPEKAVEDKGGGITAIKEWPLLVFTTIVSVLAGYSVTDKYNNLLPGERLMFFGLLILGAGISLFHLGKPFRMWRTILNVRRSWLSREIVFFALFTGSAYVKLIVAGFPDIILFIVVVLLCLSVDMLYMPVQRHWKIKLHPGQSTLIALSVFLFMQDFPQWFSCLIVLRVALLYIRMLLNKSYSSVILSTILIRTILAVIVIVLVQLNHFSWQAYTSLLVGELIDRILFYNELALYTILNRNG